MLNEHRDKSSYEMLRTLNWLAFPVRCKYFIGLLIFKAINNLIPSYISDLITFSSNNTNVLRSIAKRDISHNEPNTNYLKKTFSYSGMEIWNRIPTEIRNSQKLTHSKVNSDHFFLKIAKVWSKNIYRCSNRLQIPTSVYVCPWGITFITCNYIICFILINYMNYIVKEGIIGNNIAVINVSFLHWCVILMVYLLKIKNLLLLLLLLFQIERVCKR